MANANIFKDAAIDEDDHEQYLQNETSISKGNLIPKGVYHWKHCMTCGIIFKDL